MKDRAVIVYSPEVLRYRFGPEHPFDPLRLRMTWDLMQESGLLRPEHVRAPQPATEEELALVHDRHYIEAVKRAGQGDEPPVPPGGGEPSWESFGLGTEDTPIFPDMHEASALITGGTLMAARLVMEGKAEHAFSLAGGLHHAQRHMASGFCVYNDIGVAIAWLRKEFDARVAYIDTDAHHGDGVQWLFYDDPGVLTISFHETGKYLYPGTGDIHERGTGAGYGYSVNVPLEPFTEDDSWLELLHQALPILISRFEPDIIISQNGCDGHHLDPLTHLSATTRLYREIPKLVHQLAHEACDGRWVAVGGGGYEIWRVVPRAWTLLWAELSHQPIPEVIPDLWLERWSPYSPDLLPDRFIDAPDAFPPIPRRVEIENRNRITLRRALMGTPFYT
ncbi:acetoin utilization protein AcuC [Kyrpidia spormannii]|uniref:Acetoin utilization protein AcuC n=1 Tax=Kyrpidia spormannii TaxID=2055160 RepID=A0A2K8N6Q9_9BACL|nr:acetoin utilization protein AcuC [Kyrpidia spormannii]ATY84280.1 acetoin utilization protein AcuC [Kyrpidia spormannii]